MSSPFDALMQVREDGTEFWSARDLMEPLGYKTWREFEGVVHRAFESAKAHGDEPSNHFVSGYKMVELGSGALRPVKDVHLTRRAAYLVAMNGNPLKDEIKEAQHYFVTKTREAEVNPVQPVFDPNSVTRLEMARMLLEAETERLALEARVTELEPKAEEYDKWQNAKGLHSSKVVAKMMSARGYSVGGNVKLYRLLDLPCKEGGLGWFFHENGVRVPYQRVVDAGYVVMKPQTYTTPHHTTYATATPYFTPKAVDAIVKFLRSRAA